MIKIRDDSGEQLVPELLQMEVVAFEIVHREEIHGCQGKTRHQCRHFLSPDENCAHLMVDRDQREHIRHVCELSIIK